MRGYGVLGVCALLGPALGGCLEMGPSSDDGYVYQASTPSESESPSPTAAPSAPPHKPTPRPSPSPSPRPSSSPSPSPSSSPQPSPSSAPAPPPEDEKPSAPPRQWADVNTAAIRPGVQMFVGNGQCTSNFVFTDPDNSTVYIGFAAHCANDCPGQASCDTNGCASTNHPSALGTEVEIDGALEHGELVYTSWGTMQELQESDPDACDANDFAVVRIRPGDESRVNPAMLFFGGPVGLADPRKVSTGDKVITYGNSGLRLGISQLSPHEGYVAVSPGSGWSTYIYTVPPGVPGDSGSGVMTGDGHALGDLVTGVIIPYTGANGISTLSKELEYARQKAGMDFRLATWELINPGLLPDT